MLNKVWIDLTNRLAKEPFERMYWGLGPQWVSFIQIDSPISVDKPLWTHEESSLDNIRLFDLAPDQLHLEIFRYWQQPFWKRWFLSLFTAINSKIKLWSYFQRCLAVSEVRIKNLYDIDKPTDSVFEEYVGKEVMQRLYQSTLKLDKYIEKYAGNLKFEEDDISVDLYLRENGRFFTKLTKQKLALLDIEDTDSLYNQLRKEFDRHEMMVFCYLSAWHEKVFDEPIYFDDPAPFDTCIDPRTRRKIIHTTQSIEEWIKVKRKILESMLQKKEAPKQFNEIKIFLESTLSTIKELLNQQLQRYEKLIDKTQCERLAPDKAIQQANVLQLNLILFKKSVLLFHPDKSCGNKNLQSLQTELFKGFKQLFKDSMEQINQGLQVLEECLNKQKKIERIKLYNLRAAEFDKLKNDINARLDEVERKIDTDREGTRQAVKEEMKQIGIVIAEMKLNYSEFFKPRNPLKLMFKPVVNHRVQEQQHKPEQEETPYEPPDLRFKRRIRYRSVF